MSINLPWRRRPDETDETDQPGGELVAFPGAAVTEPDPEPAEVALPAPSRLRVALAPHVDRPLLPSAAAARVSLGWWARAAARLVGWLLTHPWMLFYELLPIWSGIFYLATVWTQWRTAAEQAEHVKAAEGDMRAKSGHYNERRREGRRRISMATAVLAIGGLIYLIGTHRWAVLAAIGVAVAGVLDGFGRRARRPKTVGARVLPRPDKGPGTPVHVIEAAIEEVLTAHGHVPQVGGGRVIEHGVSIQVSSSMEVTDAEIAAIERDLHGFPGSVVRIQDRADAALGELRWMWTDPLDRLVVPRRYAPRSQTVTAPAFQGIGWNGQELLLSFLRTNLFVVGGPGSGKTSAASTMVDFLTACDDARVSVIDLTDGPFGYMWGDAVRLATTEREAEDLLRESIDRAKRRTKAIAGRARPTRGAAPVIGSENWDPKIDGGPQHTIVIDEVPTFVPSTTLRELWAEHMRIGRKAAENSIGISQSSDGDTIKMTALRKYPTTLILFACSREDVIGLMGGGALKAGWRPDRLVPAEGDTPNDAGKAYVRSGVYQSPTPWRFPRIELEDVHARVLEREEQGWARFEDEPEPGVVDMVEVPPMLAAVEAVFRAAATPERIATAELLIGLAAHGTATNATALARALAGHLAPRPERWYATDGSRVKGYWWADVTEAINRLGGQ